MKKVFSRNFFKCQNFFGLSLKNALSALPFRVFQAKFENFLALSLKNGVLLHNTTDSSFQKRAQNLSAFEKRP